MAAYRSAFGFKPKPKRTKAEEVMCHEKGIAVAEAAVARCRHAKANDYKRVILRENLETTA